MVLIKNKCLILNFNKMKNIENYGVLALDTREIRETDGGFSPVWEWIVDETIAWVEDGGINDLAKKIADGYTGTHTQYGL